MLMPGLDRNRNSCQARDGGLVDSTPPQQQPLLLTSQRSTPGTLSFPHGLRRDKTKKYVCPQCAAVFGKASHLTAHASAVHPDNSQGEGAWLDLLQDLRS